MQTVSDQYENNLKEYQKIHPPQTGIQRFLQASARPARNAAYITLGACVVVGSITLLAYRLGFAKAILKNLQSK